MHQHLKYPRPLEHHMTRVGDHGRTAAVRSRIVTLFFDGQE
jgi:hypothetical protein